MTRSKEGIQGTVTRKPAVVLLAVDNQGLQDDTLERRSPLPGTVALFG